MHKNTSTETSLDIIPKHDNQPTQTTKQTTKTCRETESVGSIPSKGSSKISKGAKTSICSDTKLVTNKASTPPDEVMEVETDAFSEYSATEDDVESLADHETSILPLTDSESINHNTKHVKPKEFKKEFLGERKVLQIW